MIRIIKSDGSLLAILTSLMLISQLHYGRIITFSFCGLFLIIALFDLIRTKHSIKTNAYLRIGKTHSWIRRRIGLFIAGLLLVGIGLYEIYQDKELVEIPAMIIFGVFVLIYSMLIFDNFLFIIKNNSIIFVDSGVTYEWKYSKILEVEFKGNHIYFKKKKESFDYDLSDFSDLQLSTIKDKIKDKISEKVIENK